MRTKHSAAITSSALLASTAAATGASGEFGELGGISPEGAGDSLSAAVSFEEEEEEEEGNDDGRRAEAWDVLWRTREEERGMEREIDRVSSKQDYWGNQNT